jgi:hypothetical protein
MKRIAPLVGLTVAAALLGGCAVYPDGTPMVGNGYAGGYSGYDGYDGYATGVPVVPQTSVYMGYSNYSGPGYYDGPGRYYGPGPGYRGYPGYPDRGRPSNGNYGNNGNRGDNGGWHGQSNGGLKARLAGREDRVGLMRHDRGQAARRPLRHSKRVITVGAAAEAMRRPEAIATASQV